MFRFFLLLITLLLVQFSSTTHDFDETLEPITEENAHRIEQVQMLGRGGINELVWSPDGTRLAVLGPNGAWIYDAGNWTAPPFLLGGMSYYTWTGDFDPTGRLLATTDNDGWRLWDVQTNRLLRFVRQTRAFSMSTLTFSPNGQMLATTGVNGSVSAAIIQLWDVSTGRELAYLEVLNAYQRIQSLTFSADGTELIVIPAYQPIHRYRVRDLLDQSQPNTQTYDVKESFEARQAAFAETGELYFLYLAYLPDQQRQYVLQADVSDEPDVVTRPGGWYRITTVDFDPDIGLLAASGELGEIEVYSIHTGEIIRVLPGHEETKAVVIDPTGKQLVSYGDGYLLKAWNLETGAEQLVSDQHTQFGYTVTFHPNSEQIAFGTQVAGGQVQLWDVSIGSVTERIPGHPDGAWINSIAFQSDGLRMATGSGIGCCPRIWDLQEHSAYKVFAEHGTSIDERGANHVFFAQNDSMLVSSGSEGTVRIWDVQSGEAFRVFYHDNRDVLASAIGSENLYLFSITAPGSLLWVWDIETGQEVTGISQKYYADHLIISKDQSVIATILRGIITIWEPNSPESIREIDISSTTSVIADAVFSPDNKIMAIVSSHGKVQLIGVSSGILLAEIQTIDNWLTTSIDWSSDGRMIAITGREGSVHIFGVPIEV